MTDFDNLFGLACFLAVKFAGYWLAARFLLDRYPEAMASALAVGATRTAIGLAGGLLAAFAVSWLDIFVPLPSFYLLLVPMRLLEWLFLLRLFFEQPWRWSRALRWAALGTAWSCLLDVPALLAGLSFVKFGMC